MQRSALRYPKCVCHTFPVYLAFPNTGVFFYIPKHKWCFPKLSSLSVCFSDLESSLAVYFSFLFIREDKIQARFFNSAVILILSLSSREMGREERDHAY